MYDTQSGDGLSLMALNAAHAETAVHAWVQRYSHPADSDDYTRKAVIDNAGN